MENKAEKFTSGPWEVQEEKHLYSIVHHVPGKKFRVIARTPDGVSLENWANAQIMAASPCGHALIGRLWAFIENGSDSDNFFEIRAQVREYFAKVEGGHGA